MTRRNFNRLLGYFFLGSLGAGGLLCATRLIPRPPRKVFLKKETLKNKKIFLGKDFVLVRLPQKVIALSRRCPHLGCLVGFDSEKDEFVCPCHQSRFNLEGRYLAGPAKKDLSLLKLKETEGGFLLEIQA